MLALSVCSTKELQQPRGLVPGLSLDPILFPWPFDFETQYQIPHHGHIASSPPHFLYHRDTGDIRALSVYVYVKMIILCYFDPRSALDS